VTVYISAGADLLPWTDEEWLRDARAWIDEQLHGLGMHRTGEIAQVYARSWSTVLRIPTSDGVVFLKASAPTQAMEVAVVKALARWTPDVVAPLAADDARGWMLMRDAGTRLRELPVNSDVATWTNIVRLYARLQLTVTPHVDTLLALGCRDLRLHVLPQRFAALLADEDILLVGREGGLTQAEHARLLEWLPTLHELCAELAGYGIPETIEHNDLHSANVFLQGDRPLFFDWGDSSISHPFHTLRTTLAVVAKTLEVGRDEPRVVAIRDAYLAEFGDVGELTRPFALAQRTAVVTNVLTWAPFVKAMPRPFLERYGRSVADETRAILDAD
jgi:hypothetical protein